MLLYAFVHIGMQADVIVCICVCTYICLNEGTRIRERERFCHCHNYISCSLARIKLVVQTRAECLVHMNPLKVVLNGN